MKECLFELPSQPSEILSLLTIRGSGCPFGISNSSLYYLQVFTLGLIVLGCQFDVWSFPPLKVEDALYQFVTQNEGAISSFQIQLHLHLALIFALLDSVIPPSAHQLVKRDKWLVSSVIQSVPTIVPPRLVVDWLWSQQPLREWNQRCLAFWLFEVFSPLYDYYLFFVHFSSQSPDPQENSFWVELFQTNHLVCSQIFLGVLKSLPCSSPETKILSILEILSLGLKEEKSLSTVLSFVGIFEVLGDLIVLRSSEPIISYSCCLIRSILNSMLSSEQQIKSEVIFKSWGILSKLIDIFFHERDPVRLCQRAPRHVLNLCNFCLDQLKGNPFTEIALKSSNIFDFFHNLMVEVLPSLLHMAESLMHPLLECPTNQSAAKENDVCEAQSDISLLLSSLFVGYSQLFFFVEVCSFFLKNIVL